jgi:hypothetical protein
MKRRAPLSRFKRCLAVTKRGRICKLPRRFGVLCHLHAKNPHGGQVVRSHVVNPNLKVV